MEDDNPTLNEFRERLKFGVDSLADFKEDAKTYFKYYAGDQWLSEDVEALKAQDRPALVFNQTLPVINAVSGSEITNRFESKYLPRTVDDQAFSDALSDTVRYIRQQADVEHEESSAFRSAVICGVGVTEFWMDYMEGSEGRQRVDEASVFEVLWDPYAKRPNLTDGRWVIRGKWIPLDEAKARWPDSEDDLEVAVSDHDESPFPDGAGAVHDQRHAHLYRSNMHFFNTRTKEVLVYEYQWFDYDPYFLVAGSEDEGEVELSVEDFETLKERMELLGEPEPVSVKLKKRVFKRAFIVGPVVLEDDLLPVQKGFTYKFITGFQNRTDDGITWFGLMKPMVDPQNWSNKMLSQLVHVVNTNPKGTVLAEQGVFIDSAQASKDWAKPSSRIEVRPGAITNKEIMVVQGKYPADQERLMAIASEAISKVTGINPYFMGQVDDLKRTATSAIRSVQQQGMILLSVLFDALRKYRKDAGRMHLEFIREFMPEGTMIRITQQDGSQVPGEFKREWVENVEYDIVIDEAPTSTTAMTELWDSLQQTDALSTLVEIGLLTPDVIVDIMPNIPETIRSRMRSNYAQQNVVAQAVQLVAEGDPQGALQLLAQLAQQGEGGAQSDART